MVEDTEQTKQNGTTMDVPHGHAVEEEMIPSPSSERVKHRGPTKNSDAKPGTIKRRVKKKAARSEEAAKDKLIKYSALFLLVAQMVGLVLLMRYSRTSRSPDEPLYLASSAVFVMELMKFSLCSMVITYQTKGALVRELKIHVWQSPFEMLKLCVPSFLYTIQNNLLYLALTNLDAATYQVCYQLKILTTALFSAILLQVCTFVIFLVNR